MEIPGLIAINSISSINGSSGFIKFPSVFFMIRYARCLSSYVMFSKLLFIFRGGGGVSVIWVHTKFAAILFR